MRCNCSETQEKMGLVCMTTLLSSMWFINVFENVFQICKYQATSPESCIDWSWFLHVVWVFSLPTFGIEFKCRWELKIKVQTSKSAHRTSNLFEKEKCNCLSWRECFLKTKYTRKCSVQVCVWDIWAREGIVFWTLCLEADFIVWLHKGNLSVIKLKRYH